MDEDDDTVELPMRTTNAFPVIVVHLPHPHYPTLAACSGALIVTPGSRYDKVPRELCAGCRWAVHGR